MGAETGIFKEKHKIWGLLAEQRALAALPVPADALFYLRPGALEIGRQAVDAQKLLGAPVHQLAVDGDVVPAQGAPHCLQVL